MKKKPRKFNSQIVIKSGFKKRFSELKTACSVVFSWLVPLVGVEPTTRGLGNRCSIQLSYRGAVTSEYYTG